ncbi:hypothetical protein D3C86_1138270 [compost metagenome]
MRRLSGGSSVRGGRNFGPNGLTTLSVCFPTKWSCQALTGFGGMELEYTFNIAIDGQWATSELYAADHGAARDQALMATSEALRDYALRRLPLTTLTVNVESASGETIFEARVMLA